MTTVNPNDLERIIKDAGLGDRTAKKLRNANTEPAPQPRGHGAASQDLSPLGDF